MKRVLMLALGILSAIGGFVDIGDLVFNAQAGAIFGYQLLWVLPIGVTGIIVYSEMCGRVAAASGRPVFDVVRERLGFRLGLVALLAAVAISLMTLVAEIGGVALAIELMTGSPYRLLVALAVIGLGLAIWTLSFSTIENLFSLFGLCLIVFVVAALVAGVDWHGVAQGFVPGHHATGQGSHGVGWAYAYFVVGLLGAAMTPYEVYFYSSGAVEDHWSLSDLGTNKFTAVVGYSLGGLLSAALMATSAAVLLPDRIRPEFIGSIAMMAQEPLGQAGLLLAAVGILFATGGAAIETVLSAAYAICQTFGWEWGVERGSRAAPRFTLLWPVLLVGAGLVTLSGINPVQLTEYAVIFSALALPLTYIPILLVANDRRYLHDKVNGRLANTLGVIFLVMVVAISIASVPLMLLSHGGSVS
ncbi:MAG: divalent metal cation transporter [Thermoleophilia bacterium]|nr:divalent metal cation transporter [Thermoleophilia bacterium]